MDFNKYLITSTEDPEYDRPGIHLECVQCEPWRTLKEWDDVVDLGFIMEAIAAHESEGHR